MVGAEANGHDLGTGLDEVIECIDVDSKEDGGERAALLDA